MLEHNIALKEHFIKFFENVLAGGDQIAEHERLILQSLPKEEKIKVVEMFFSIKNLFKTEKIGDAFLRKKESRAFESFSAVNSFLRNLLGIAIFFILLCSGLILAAALFEHFKSDPDFHAFTQLGGYLTCLALIYFLEGGQAARFMAKGDPPEIHGARARRFLIKDMQNDQSMQSYVGIRQFFTLGVTTISYVLFVKNWSITAFPFISGGVSDAVLLFSHILFATTVFQILPQLRANRSASFFNSSGSVFTYYACEMVAKVFDPSLPAQYIDKVMGKSGSFFGDKETVAAAADDEMVFLTDKVTKYKTAGKWFSPFEVRKILKNNGIDANVGWLTLPAASQHYPPHYALAVLMIINKKLNSSEALHYVVLNAFFSVIEHRTTKEMGTVPKENCLTASRR